MVAASATPGSTIDHFNSRYAHEAPNALDSYIVSYNSLESEAEIKAKLLSQTGNFSIAKSNEPEFVCRC